MKKGFTLIELLAVIVVLAILALVVTPIVLNIVENAQTGSDERSLEQYAKVMQTTYYEKKMKDTALTLQDYLNQVDTGSVSGVSLTYNGSRVECSEKVAKETASGASTIELYNCTIDGRGMYQFVDGKAEKIGEENKTEQEEPNDDNTTDSIYFDAYALTYTPMEIVYFNVKEGTLCTKQEYDSSWDGTDYSNSYTNYNGITKTNDNLPQNSCLKFYKYAEDNKRNKNIMLLDHNTSKEILWSNSIAQLENDTQHWSDTLIQSKNYQYNSNTKQYTIDYTGYKARFITANEIAKITGNTNWEETTSTTSYYFDSLTSTPSAVCTEGNTSECQYGWLYDRTSKTCEDYGCLNNSTDFDGSYFTSSYDVGSTGDRCEDLVAWIVYYDHVYWGVGIGGLLPVADIVSEDWPCSGIRHETIGGIRPVIEIPKS